MIIHLSIQPFGPEHFCLCQSNSLFYGQNDFVQNVFSKAPALCWCTSATNASVLISSIRRLANGATDFLYGALIFI